MVRQLLDSYGIPCRVVSDVPHSLFPLTVDGLGEIRILVAEECIEEARALIAEHKRRGLEVVEGGKEASDGAAAERDPADPSAGDVSGRRGGS